MKRILLTCHQFYPNYYTGTETLTLETALALKKQGYHVAVVTFEPNDTLEDYIQSQSWRREIYAGIEIYRIFGATAGDVLTKLEWEAQNYIFRETFEEILDDFLPDAVYALHLMRLTIEFVRCVKKRRIPIFAVITDFWLICPTYQLLRHNGDVCQGPQKESCFACLVDRFAKKQQRYSIVTELGKRFPRVAGFFNRKAMQCMKILDKRRDIQRVLFGMMDGVVWANHFSQQIFHHNGFVHEHEYVIPFPLPSSNENLRDLTFPSTINGLNVAFIGSFRHSKGPQVLLQAAAQLCHKEEVQFFFWGNQEQPDAFTTELFKIAAGDARIKFCGVFPQDKFKDVLQNIHVVVIPSLWYENTPLTAIAALAGKRILVVSDVGGLSSLVVNGRTGFTFMPGHAGELAQVIKKLLGERETLNAMTKGISSPLTSQAYSEELISLLTDYQEKQLG